MGMRLFSLKLGFAQTHPGLCPGTPPPFEKGGRKLRFGSGYAQPTRGFAPGPLFQAKAPSKSNKPQNHAARTHTKFGFLTRGPPEASKLARDRRTSNAVGGGYNTKAEGLELTLIWLPAVGIIYIAPSDGFVKNLRVEIFAKQKYYPVLDKSKLCAP